MQTILLAAIADNRAIGNKGQLPWHNSEDLQNFKRLTTGGIVVMGRKTYESIGRPLPNRRNIILTSSMIEGLETYASIEEMAESLENEGIDTVFIIGGQTIYEAFLDRGLVDEAWISRIPGEHEGDAFLIEFESDFREVERKGFETFEWIRYIKTASHT
ncbi:MAG: dihydrofolate reductase [Candidatus Gracilibacteria bacterium]|nr:dihydrofolate reductase [Candidatus Gracilibacteria bacterium]